MWLKIKIYGGEQMINKHEVGEMNYLKLLHVESLEAVHTQCACSAFNI